MPSIRAALPNALLGSAVMITQRIIYASRQELSGD